MDMVMVNTTIERIKIWHDGQYYGTKPYWTHCLAVADYGYHFFKSEWNENAHIAALLHDVIEDTDITASILEHTGYNQNIIDTVVLLTKDKNLTYEENIKKIINSKNHNAMMVKYSDNFVNFTGDKYDWERNRRMKSQTKYAKSMGMLLDALS